MVISVIMPVFNAEKYLKESIESILNQTFKDFEFLIFNDASTDGSLKIIEYYSKKDNRIIVINSEINKGYPFHLNEGLKLSKGAFIARMDADDISDISRFEKQIELFSKNNDLVLCGSWAKTFGNSNKNINYPVRHEEINKYLIFANPFCHPSIMLRKSFLEMYKLKYDESKIPAEDANLWSKILQFGGICENIPLYLIQYRLHNNQISQIKRQKQSLLALNLYLNHVLFLSKIIDFDIENSNSYEKIVLIEKIYKTNNDKIFKINLLLLTRKILNNYDFFTFSEFIKIQKLAVFKHLKMQSKIKFFFKTIF
ncbi:MAG: glycosyltransferase [Cytophagales bacterium]|nr:MAG: glycosyltransferase [Cytophagales bacterium]